MTENPYASPTSTPPDEEEQVHATSRLAAFGEGAWRGAKRGFIIVACIAVVIGAVCWSLVFLVFKPSSLESGLKELPLLPIAACMYGLVGAAIGAVVMGTRTSRRFKDQLQLIATANSQQPQSPPEADQPDG
jgi:glycerol-3-phosphate acyltransferase PlsY